MILALFIFPIFIFLMWLAFQPSVILKKKGYEMSGSKVFWLYVLSSCIPLPVIAITLLMPMNK